MGPSNVTKCLLGCLVFTVFSCTVGVPACAPICILLFVQLVLSRGDSSLSAYVRILYSFLSSLVL